MPVLLGPHDALQHRVDRLQVRRVGDHRDRGGVLAVRGGELAGLAEVVLHVAGALRGLRVEVPLELGEDLLVRLADDVGQHVEPAPVGHADDDLVQAGLGGGLQHLVEQRDQRLAALQREPLLADVLGLQEGLERLGRVEPVEDVLLLLRRSASRTGARPAPGSSAAPPGPGCACTRRRPGGSRSRAARRGCRAASSSACRRSRRPGRSRSRSHRVRPCWRTSRSGCRRISNSSGSVSAIRWPRTR